MQDSSLDASTSTEKHFNGTSTPLKYKRRFNPFDETFADNSTLNGEEVKSESLFISEAIIRDIIENIGEKVVTNGVRYDDRKNPFMEEIF